MISELVRRTARIVLPEGLRFPTRVAVTRAISVIERRRARRLARAQPLLLHLGCGENRKQGWVNVDLVGPGADISWDLLAPLPFPDASADAVYLEHVFEHFDPDDGSKLLRNCSRVLKPNGILRVVVPDVWRYAVSYVNDPASTYIHAVRPGRATALLAFQEIFFWYGHRAAYDAETLTYVLRRSGFVSIRECQCNETDLPDRPDNEDRQRESLYMECRMPSAPNTQRTS